MKEQQKQKFNWPRCVWGWGHGIHTFKAVQEFLVFGFSAEMFQE